MTKCVYVYCNISLEEWEETVDVLETVEPWERTWNNEYGKPLLMYFLDCDNLGMKEGLLDKESEENSLIVTLLQRVADKYIDLVLEFEDELENYTNEMNLKHR